MAEVRAITAEVVRHYPEMEGVEPAIAVKGTAAPFYTLTYRRVWRAEGGAELVRIVRATVDATGRLVKLSASK